jgi:hypothetical protein
VIKERAVAIQQQKELTTQKKELGYPAVGY